MAVKKDMTQGKCGGSEVGFVIAGPEETLLKQCDWHFPVIRPGDAYASSMDSVTSTQGLILALLILSSLDHCGGLTAGESLKLRFKVLVTRKGHLRT